LDAELRLTAITDRARWITARLLMERERPVGITEIRIGPLRDGAGVPLPRGGHGGDSEAIARLPDGSWIIAFERWHRLRAYRRLDGPGTFVEAPPGIERAPRNGGMEALAVLADGRWLVLAEQLAPEGAPEQRMAWIGGPGRWTPLAYRPAPGFEPTDAAALPDGGALVLERRFSFLAGGFSGRIVRLSPAALRAGGVLEGAELIRLAHPLPAENWEGIAVARWQGRLIVAVVSDDNQSVLQRSLLLVFELREE
ncbi:MAG TPA: esterase-like activity of phytase family protein, partial [Acetobacteraceae bacterium]|nr:esterase-like activity of phytase family protein [Acetobacteraceae bacterium]